MSCNSNAAVQVFLGHCVPSSVSPQWGDGRKWGEIEMENDMQQTSPVGLQPGAFAICAPTNLYLDVFQKRFSVQICMGELNLIIVILCFTLSIYTAVSYLKTCGHHPFFTEPHQCFLVFFIIKYFILSLLPCWSSREAEAPFLLAAGLSQWWSCYGSVGPLWLHPSSAAILGLHLGLNPEYFRFYVCLGE